MSKKSPAKEKRNFFIPRIPLMYLGIFFIFWSYVVIKNYYAQYPVNLNYLNYVFMTGNYPGLEGGQQIRVLLGHAVSCLGLAFILMSCFGAGACLFNRFKLKDELTVMENVILSFSLGLGIIIFLTLLSGALGLFYKWFVLLYLIPCCICGIWFSVKYFKERKKQKSAGKTAKFSLIERYLALIFIVVTLIKLIGALAPETFYDSQHYHLAVPLCWVHHHRISIVPYVLSSFFPMNIHVVYSLGLLFNNDIIPKLLHFAFSVLSFWAIFAFGRRWINRKAALLAAVFFYTAPMVMMVTARSSIEMGLAFFEICAAYALFMYISRGGKNIIWLILSGINCGLAVGGKHSSIMCMIAAVGSLMVWLVWKKYDIKKVLKISFIYVAIISTVAGPWYVRNLVVTGNPVFPQFFGKISDYTGDLHEDRGLNELNITSDMPMKKTSYAGRLLVPWDLTMGKYPEGYSGAVFLFLLPLLFLVGRTPKETKIFVVYFTIYFLLWLASAGYLRYFIPAIPIICLLLAASLDSLGDKLFLKKGIMFILSVMILTNVYFVLTMQKINKDPLGVVLGLQSRYDYLSTQRPSYPCPYYAGVDWANKNLPEDSRILFIGETRGLFSERQFVIGGPFNKTPIIEWTKESKTADRLYDKLRGKGITHIFFNLAEAARLMAFKIFYWTDEERRVYDEFWKKYVKQIYSHKYVYVYEILSPEKAAEPHSIPINFVAQLPEIIEQRKKSGR